MSAPSLEGLFPPLSGQWLDAGTQEAYFEREWPTLQRRFFKLETLQKYDETGVPVYEAWRRGDLDEVRRLAGEQARDDLADPVSRRITSVRVRVLDLPVSNYVRFENEVYRSLAGAGEDVRGVASPELPTELRGRLQDFLLFDDRLVFVHDYDDEGRRRGSWVVAQPDGVTPFIHLAEELIRLSEPFENLVTRYF